MLDIASSSLIPKTPAASPETPGGSGSSALLNHMARIMRLQAESALAPLGLRPRHLVALSILRDHDGGTQQTLAALLSIDRTNLVGLLNDLETEGWIERRRDTEDRRRHLVVLTETGSEKLADAEAALVNAEDHVLRGLDEAQRQQLQSLLQLAAAGHAAGHAGGCTEQEPIGHGSACLAAQADEELGAC
ncbi:MAG: MarR family winged helix-turn-helix transcriptional regulator [Solirubrobacteraceae bacterium]|nr:MarR family winged helix-turn-helix transcriptional regulator [Solirubrobacteraceae bacterium]